MYNPNGYSSKANANRAARTNNTISYELAEVDGRWHVVVQAPPAKRAVSERSNVDSPVRVVWGVVGSMLGARRRDQMAECIRAGVAKYTARTQIQLARGYYAA